MEHFQLRRFQVKNSCVEFQQQGQVRGDRGRFDFRGWERSACVTEMDA